MMKLEKRIKIWIEAGILEEVKPQKKFTHHPAHKVYANTLDFWVHVLAWKYFLWDNRWCNLSRKPRLADKEVIC